jgi:DNA-binding GntR family transcriptional regulator
MRAKVVVARRPSSQDADSSGSRPSAQKQPKVDQRHVTDLAPVWRGTSSDQNEQPIPFVTKRHSVVERLRSEILDGSRLSGEQLQQEEVAARFGVSATPVREAFGILEAEGFLESKPHRGVIVAERQLADLEDVYEIREALELLAIRRVVRRVTPGVIRELEAVLADAARGLLARDIQHVRRANTQFHQVLLRVTESPVLIELTNRVIARSLFFLPAEMTRFEEIHIEELARNLRAMRPGR